MSPLKVLLVVYTFPPVGGVGTLRAASLARYLPFENIQLDVLTTRNPSSVGMDYSLLKEIPQEVTIHRTLTLDLPFSVKKRLKRLLSGAKSAPVNAGASTAKPNFLKRIVQYILMPDPQVTWLPVLTRAARKIVREKGIDLVLITGSPYSSFLLAEKLRSKFRELAIVLDFRDEWLATAFDVAAFQFGSSSDHARRFAIKAEAEAVASSNAVVMVTEAARREIHSRYPADPLSKYHYVPNGFDATRLQSSPRASRLRSPGRIVVTYVGSIYASTEPTSFVQALHMLPADIKAQYTFRFIGHVEDLHDRKALLSLGDIVELKGYMPQHEALSLMNETDYVLLISHDRLNVSAKFYDYIGAGKPILACVHPAGDIRLMIEDLRAGWWADSQDVEAISKLFRDTAVCGDARLQSFEPDAAKIARYERKPIAQRYAALLHSITAFAHARHAETETTGETR
jgi:glycosyltransferase involved in cell wall biosynthesis